MTYSATRKISIPTASPGASGDTIARMARPRLLALSRQLYRDSVIYRGIVDRIADCVGAGWSLQRADNDARAEEAARGWAAACGAAGEPLDDLLRVLAREWVLTGEAWAVYTTAGVQVVESEHVDDIERAPGGALTAVAVREIRGGRVESRKISSENLAWIVDTDQPSARRGVPVMQAAFPVIALVQDVLESEARSWRIQSKLVMTILSQDAGAAMGEADDQGVEVVEDDLAYIWQARPGDSLNVIDRSIPGRNFTDGLRTYLRIIGQAVGLPLEVVLLDWTQSNFSQSRAALAAANAWFEKKRKIFSRMISRIVGWALPGPWAPVARALPWTDPQAEIEISAARLDRGLSSYSEEARRLGVDPGDLRAQVAADIEAAVRLAREIEARTGVQVPWERLCGYAPGKTALAMREAGARKQEELQ